MRPMGEILLDLEVLLDEMVDKQDLQMGDILSLVKGHLEIHRPDCIEKYADGTYPIMYYGHREEINLKE